MSGHKIKSQFLFQRTWINAVTPLIYFSLFTNRSTLTTILACHFSYFGGNSRNIHQTTISATSAERSTLRIPRATMSAPPSSKRSPPKRRLDSFPLPPLYYNKETIVDKTGRVHSVINMRGRSTGSTTPPCSPQSFNSVSPASQNQAIRGLSNTLLSAKELTPPSSPIKNRKMLYSTPSPACTVKTVPMTPETIASLSSSQLSPFAMSRTYAAVSTPTNVSSLTTLATPTKSYQHHSLSSSSPTRSEYSTTVGHSIHSPTQRSHRDVDPSDFGFCTPTNRSPSKKKIPFALGSLSPDDSSRKQKAKTELCMHYISNRVCPFGNNCTYAHGENELQKTKLIDLQRSGLIDDVESYRTKPCFTWVMVGSW